MRERARCLQAEERPGAGGGGLGVLGMMLNRPREFGLYPP